MLESLKYIFVYFIEYEYILLFEMIIKVCKIWESFFSVGYIVSYIFNLFEVKFLVEKIIFIMIYFIGKFYNIFGKKMKGK